MGFSLTDIIGGTLGDSFKKIVGSFKLDPEIKAKLDAALEEHDAAFKLAQLEAEGKIETAIAAQVLAQIEVNKADATSGNWYQSGWRPSCGYVCVIGLLYEFLLQPLLSWGGGIWGFAAAPKIDLGQLVVLLGGMLGLGTLRTVEKMKGAA